MGAQETSQSPKGRTILSLIVQRSCIELFAAYGVTVAPVPTARARGVVRPPDHVVGVVHVVAGTKRGTISLSASPATLKRMKTDEVMARSQSDWIRELANQVSGRIKNKLARYALTIHLSLPMALSSSASDRGTEAKDTDLVLLFHTLREQVLITLTGGFDDTGLVLQGDAPVAEGEIILF